MGTLLVHLLVGTRVLLLVAGLLVGGLGLGLTVGRDTTHLLVLLLLVVGGGLLLGLLDVLVVHVGLVWGLVVVVVERVFVWLLG